jgi:hypothetical protein
MELFDFCLAWEWQYDKEFVHLLETACQDQQISLLQVTPLNLENTLQSLNNNELAFQAFLDRASDENPNYVPLVDWAHRQGVYRINPYGLARRAWNKASCHVTFTQAGLYAPDTYFLPSCNEQPDLEPLDISPLGCCLSVKPVHGGGGKGVVNGVTTWEQILAARQAYPDDEYIVQSLVTPAVLGGHPAWFRVIFCGGQVYSSWWDTCTHIYTPVTEEEEQRFGLDTLRRISRTIAALTKLELFSSEIALTPQGEFLVIDYINDPIDLRPQSSTPEGVPDSILAAIARQVACMASIRTRIQISIE